MKKISIIAAIVFFCAAIISCKGAGGEYTGDTYAPDMAYSRAYETYAYNSNDAYNSLKKRGIRYDAAPVKGTIARGDFYNYHLTADSAGMTAANALVNPFDSAATAKSTLKEGERLYLVNCAICHGTKLDGNGPLFADGNGPYPAAPKNLVADDAKSWPNGHYYYVITYGKGQMGSYASQLHPEQRWWVINYIRSRQGGGAKAGATTDSTGSKAMDSTSTAKK